MEKSIYSPKHGQLADMLERLRKDAGLIQQDIADPLGRRHPFVHDYETGQRRLDVVRLREVAHALGTTLSAIVDNLFANSGTSPSRVDVPEDTESLPSLPPHPEEWTRLCALLRSLRQAAGLTQVEVAARLSEPQSFVSKYETKLRRLDLIELEQVAVALDTTLLAVVHEFEYGTSVAGS